ncbi:MAG: polysaccharide deacetylase family protein [Thiolinea sp.]
MNWSLLGMLLLVVLITLIVGITILFFIRHWANRSFGHDSNLTANEGQYFVRYLPPGLQLLDPEPVRPRRSLRKPTQYVLSTLFAVGLLGLLGAATYVNRDKLAAPIDLTEQELAALTISSYRWESKDFQKLPQLNDYLEQMRADKTGLLLVDSASLEAWPKQTGNLAEQAIQHWESFADRYHLAFDSCAWEKLADCRADKKDWIIVMLPGLWDQGGLHALLDEQARIIAYGPPQQIFMDKRQSFTLAGLQFEYGLTPDSPDLALRGDQELTLGFDAGMIIHAQPAFANYQAHSDHPQAVAINEEHLAGGRQDTRLFAHAAATRGRLVWMDFSPDEATHDDLTRYYFNSVLAGIFRFLDGKPYSGWANWPQGKQFAALLEEDSEDDYTNAERIAGYFQGKNYPITWYALSNEAQEHRALTRMMRDVGEIACHGDNHMDFPRQDLRTQHIRIARCRKVMEQLTGQTVTAFRPPREAHNADTLSAMTNNGITHFIAKVSGNRFTPAVYGHDGNDTALISIPRMNADDYLLWDQLKLSDAESIDQLQQEMNWIRQIGGLFMFSFHTQYMDDHKHLNTVIKLADAIHTQQAFFATSSDIANWWRLRIQLQGGGTPEPQLLEKFRPVRLQVNANGQLQQTPVHSITDITWLNKKRNEHEIHLPPGYQFAAAHLRPLICRGE